MSRQKCRKVGKVTDRGAVHRLIWTANYLPGQVKREGIWQIKEGKVSPGNWGRVTDTPGRG